MTMSLATVDPIVAALPMPVILVSPGERVAAMNAGARVLVSTAEPGRHYITALRQPALLDAVEQCLTSGVNAQSRYLGRSGARDTTWRVTVSPVFTDEGRAALLTFEDITAVEEATQMRRDFVANVSHELRTPLTSLLGFVETLRGPARNDPAAQERFLSIMEAEASRMAQLVRDLLSLGRVEEEERLRPVDPVEICAVLESAIASLEPIAAARGNSLHLARPEDEITVPGDAVQLRQVFVNLIENALKYGGAGKPVKIEVTGPAIEPSLMSQGIRVSISDQGEGFSEHHIPRLTERFYRVDSHRSREVGGTGLGLAIVKHIINRHRGRLRIDSEIGKGSRFSVILPMA